MISQRCNKSTQRNFKSERKKWKKEKNITTKKTREKRKEEIYVHILFFSTRNLQITAMNEFHGIISQPTLHCNLVLQFKINRLTIVLVVISLNIPWKKGAHSSQISKDISTYLRLISYNIIEEWKNGNVTGSFIHLKLIDIAYLSN